MLASVTAYGAFRSKTAVKSVVRSVVDFGLQAMPGPANRVADYILSRRKRTLDGATPGKAAGIPGSTKNTFEDLLCRADARLDHLQILQLMQHSGCLSETSLHRYLTAAGLARRIESLESVTVDTSLGFPETRLFHALRLQQYRGEITATASDIERAYQTFKQHRLFKEAAVNLSADLLARRGNAHQLGTFLAQLQPQEHR